MDSLPTELKEKIADHVADFALETPKLASSSLAALRLTCRSWSDAPVSQLFKHIHVIIASRHEPLPLARLLAIAQTSHLANKIRHLTVLVACGSSKSHKTRHQHTKREYPFISNRQTLFWKRVHSTQTPAPCKCENVSPGAAVLAEIAYDLGPYSYVVHTFRAILTKYTRLQSLDFHDLASYTASYVPEFNDLRGQGLHRGWASESWLVNDLISAYVLTHRTSITELCISVNHDDINHHGQKYYMSKPLRHMYRYATTSRTRALALRKLCLKFSAKDQSRRLNRDHVVCMLNALLSDEKELPNLEFLALIFPEPSPPPVPANEMMALSIVSRTRFPKLHTLALHGFHTNETDELTSFIRNSTPTLRDLRLGSTRLAPGETWWEVFEHLRESAVQLQHFTLTGPKLVDASTTWRISDAENDPRPITHGDSIQHNQIEMFVTRRSDEDPRVYLDSQMRRVSVWGARTDRKALLAGIGQ